MTCKECNGKMKHGVAMQNTMTGIPDFPSGEVVTVSPGGQGKLIECVKCVDCGWSVSK